MIGSVTAQHPNSSALRIVDPVVISPARLHGGACFRCGSTTPPLHPDGTVGTRVAPDVVKEWPVVVCADHVQVSP